jgi:hypothetical protein
VEGDEPNEIAGKTALRSATEGLTHDFHIEISKFRLNLSVVDD